MDRGSKSLNPYRKLRKSTMVRYCSYSQSKQEETSSMVEVSEAVWINGEEEGRSGGDEE